MRAESTEMFTTPARDRRVHALAIGLAVLLVLCWTIGDWPRISALRLPDNDDMMRLAQVRDLIAGQRFDDWTQYRLAPPDGAPMHWSRIGDLGIAALILAARPLLGTGGAEVAAVILYPGLLFVGFLVLSGRLGRQIGGEPARPVAILIAALAYPAIALFIPGRIDHHGLQILLAMGIVDRMGGRATAANGGAIGAMVAISMAVGLESAPQIGALVILLTLAWAWRGAGECARLGGFAAMLGATTLAMLALFRPVYWSGAWCDAFTPASSTATLLGAAGIGLLAVLSPRLHGRGARLVAAVLAGGVVAGLAVAGNPVCLTGPYGPMDPWLYDVWMQHVTEARGVFAPALSYAIPNVGLMIAAAIATAILVRMRPALGPRIAPAATVLLTSLMVALIQMRGVYIGAAFAAPLLAPLVVAVRRSGRPLRIAAAWTLSTGILYLAVPALLNEWTAPQARRNFQTLQECKGPAALDVIGRLPAGVMMAPLDIGAYTIGATHHGAIAAGYHRNNRGNRAMYEFFLSPPERSRAIARQWRVDYVVICPTDFGEIEVATAYRASLAAALVAGRTPGWLDRVPVPGTALQLYRIRK